MPRLSLEEIERLRPHEGMTAKEFDQLRLDNQPSNLRERKTAAKKTTAKKTAAKTSTPRKTAAKKTTAKKTTARSTKK